MTVLAELGSIVLMALGLAFLVVAAVGFVRLPDVFCRLHVTGVLDTLGAPLLLLGIAVWVAPQTPLVAGKLVLGLAFLLVSSPLIGHLLSRAAFETLEPGGDEEGVSMEAQADPARADGVSSR